ncbi:hypothetical protein CFC21_061060 [Triticum aestivum]|nr:uncharacterized protein LOC109769510 [Aegilops tauschii subsp. strangulata]XP_044374096.1 uncharacterized protein LOC123096417 isoform X1 [Triticum aestivum]KAF7053061.1 hypothetical protein CFC21_061060 [Triticum aestivum]
MLRLPCLLRGVSSTAASSLRRAFRSAASLEAILSHSHPSKASSEDQAGPAHLALYNYPTFAGAYSALAADLFHRRLGRRLLVLPFSSVEPFRAEDFKGAGFHSCYLLDFIGPRNFALELSRFIPSVVAFDHRQSTLGRIPQMGRCPTNLDIRIDTSKSSARAVLDYFSNKLTSENPDSETCENLLGQEDEERVSNVVKYVEDADLRQWQLPDSRAFHTALRDERAKLNCVSNPHVFEQLMQLDVSDLLARGNSLAQNRLEAARKLIHNPFKLYLGQGLYGECLAIRADGDSKLSHEIGLELSKMSASAGLRPIGAVVFMQRGLLKICLRTTDNTTNTAEIAKAYGGGGKASSSSFALRMDEFNAWIRENT